MTAATATLNTDTQEKKKRTYPGKKRAYGYDQKWLSFYFYKWNKPEGIRLVISPASYFDNRAMISICLGWVSIYLNLPIYSTWDDCEYPEYGFYYHDNMLVLEYGYGHKKKKFISMPWLLEWVRTSRLKKDGTWDDETETGRKSERIRRNNSSMEQEQIYDYHVLWSERHPYKYTLKWGEVQNRFAEIKVSEREWRPRWFKWTSLFSFVRKSIEIEFSDEVGERSGSWKGGTLGCSYSMLPSETPEQTLRRMERERKF